MWTKKAVSAFYDVSLTTVDNWIRSGCPAEYGDDGRLVGMLAGEVQDWGASHPNLDVQRRFREAGYKHHGLMISKVIFTRAEPYLDALMAAGLSKAKAECAYLEISKCAGKVLAYVIHTPPDELHGMAKLGLEREEADE